MSSLSTKITNYITSALGVGFIVMAMIKYFKQDTDTSIWFLVAGVVIGLFLIYVKNVEARKVIIGLVEKYTIGKGNPD